MVKNGEDLKVIGGTQLIERMDIRDATSSIIKLLNTPSKQWKSVYNLGAGTQFTLLEMAKEVIKIGKVYNEINPSKINFEEKEVSLKFGMDITSFCNDTGWNPTYKLSDIIHSLFKYNY